jgi:hypothetical protein
VIKAQNVPNFPFAVCENIPRENIPKRMNHANGAIGQQGTNQHKVIAGAGAVS